MILTDLSYDEIEKYRNDISDITTIVISREDAYNLFKEER